MTPPRPPRQYCSPGLTFTAVHADHRALVAAVVALVLAVVLILALAVLLQLALLRRQGVARLRRLVLHRLRLDRHNLLDLVILGGGGPGALGGRHGVALLGRGARRGAGLGRGLEQGGWFTGGLLVVGTPRLTVVLGEPLHPELLGHGEEGVELLLRHVHLAVVHEVEHGHEVRVLDALEVEQRVLVAVPPQDRPEERRAGREDHLGGVYILGIIRRVTSYQVTSSTSSGELATSSTSSGDLATSSTSSAMSATS